MSGAMSGHCGQTLGKTLKGDEEPWVDDVYDYLLEGLEEEEGHGAAVSSQAPRKASTDLRSACRMSSKRSAAAMATTVSTARLVLEVTMATPRAAQNALGVTPVVAWH